MTASLRYSPTLKTTTTHRQRHNASVKPRGRNIGWCYQENPFNEMAYHPLTDKLLNKLLELTWVCECDVPLVGMPIQLRYRVSFLDMYVLPRAGRPTITMTVGGLAKWGAPAAAEKETCYHNSACLQTSARTE